MQYIYIVISAEGFIFGAYADRNHAEEVFNALAADHPGLRLSHEPLIKEAAHFPKSLNIFKK